MSEKLPLPSNIAGWSSKALSYMGKVNRSTVHLRHCQTKERFCLISNCQQLKKEDKCGTFIHSYTCETYVSGHKSLWGREELTN